MDRAAKDALIEAATDRIYSRWSSPISREAFDEIVSMSHAASEDYLEYVRRLVEAVENGSTGVSDER